MVFINILSIPSAEPMIPHPTKGFFVKPGIVFISFNKILFEDFSKKKSTLAKPKIFNALQLSIAISLISLRFDNLFQLE